MVPGRNPFRYSQYVGTLLTGALGRLAHLLARVECHFFFFFF